MLLTAEPHPCGQIPPATQRIARSLLSPLCGIDQMIGMMLRGANDPRFVVTGAELTGVHLVLDQPKPASYHIGGTGIRLQEALIRTLGESLERYSQLMSGVSGRHPTRMATYEDLLDGEVPVTDPAALRFFDAEQLATPGFPFAPFAADAPLAWIEAASLYDGTPRLVPAQLALVGYRPRGDLGERWLIPAVTTGTAAHTDGGLALRNALMELVQIDAAMGHWYSDAVAPQIVLGDRAPALAAILARSFSADGPRPRFHWLAHPDLPGISVACVLEAQPGSIPATAVGLGADFELESAAYKALLETVGVLQLAKLNLVQAQFADEESAALDPDAMLDLDSNVAWYAQPEQRAIIDAKFDPRATIGAAEIQGPVPADARAATRALVDGMRVAGHDAAFLDLTTPDIAALGFRALRVWSPDLLAMPLPSLPPLAHPRFLAYGGASHRRPHPYP